MNHDVESERLVFEKIAPQFEKDGFAFLSNKAELLPRVVSGYILDFVAQRGDEYVAIEVKNRRTRASEASLENLRKKFESVPNWSFRYFFFEEEIDENGPRVLSDEYINQSILELRSVSDSGHYKSAFLLSWAIFEAAARAKHRVIFSKPQTPGRIITVLAERGILTVDEADPLRDLSRKRNLFIHGGLEVIISYQDIDVMVGSILHILHNS